MPSPAHHDSISTQFMNWADRITAEFDGTALSLDQDKAVAAAISGLRQAAQALTPKHRVRQCITLERYWSEDGEFVEALEAPSMFAGWMQQIRDEFDTAASNAGVVAYQGEGRSVVSWISPEVSVTVGKNGSVVATFTMVLDFVHGLDVKEGENIASVIDRCFFDGVAGEFTTIDVYDEASS